jgi:hypothetical protein
MWVGAFANSGFFGNRMKIVHKYEEYPFGGQNVCTKMDALGGEWTQ